jgi:hypothetical protein
MEVSMSRPATKVVTDLETGNEPAESSGGSKIEAIQPSANLDGCVVLHEI